MCKSIVECPVAAKMHRLAVCLERAFLASLGIRRYRDGPFLLRLRACERARSQAVCLAVGLVRTVKRRHRQGLASNCPYPPVRRGGVGRLGGGGGRQPDDLLNTVHSLGYVTRTVSTRRGIIQRHACSGPPLASRKAIRWVCLRPRPPPSSASVRGKPAPSGS
jgi:hypothetical protein